VITPNGWQLVRATIFCQSNSRAKELRVNLEALPPCGINHRPQVNILVIHLIPPV